MSLFDTQFSGHRRWLRIGDTYEVTKKPRGLDTSKLAAIPFVPMTSIREGGAYTPDFTLKCPTKIRSGTYFELGDILIAKITPSFENGKQSLVTRLPASFGFATTEIIPLRPRIEEHDRRLLFFYLLHPDVRRQIAEHMEGSTGRRRVPVEVLLDLPVPEFELEEQTAISDSLETIQRSIANETKSAQTATAFKHAAMQTLLTRGLRGEAQKETEIGSMPKSWEPKPILELCEIWSGGTPRKSVTEYWVGKIPWVSGKDLKFPYLDDSMDHVTLEGLEAGSRLAPANAVLLLVRGMGLAKDLPVSVINRPMAFNQDIKALVSRGVYSGKFLRSAIYVGKDRLLSQIVPSAHGTMTLSLNDVENFEIPCPPDPIEVDEIVAIIEAIDRKIDLHRRKRAILQELFKALLHKLMTGEIRVSDLDLTEVIQETQTS